MRLLTRLRLTLQVKASKKVNFQDIVKLEILSDDEQIVLISLRSQTMRLAVKDSVAFVCAIQKNMKVRASLPENKLWSCFVTFLGYIESSIWYEDSLIHSRILLCSWIFAYSWWCMWLLRMMQLCVWTLNAGIFEAGHWYWENRNICYAWLFHQTLQESCKHP